MQHLIMKVISSDDERFPKGTVFVHMKDGRALPLQQLDDDTQRRINMMVGGVEPDAPIMQLSVWEMANVGEKK